MINKKVNNYFLILFSILPITIVSGPAVSLINILLIDLSFLVLILFIKDYSFLKSKPLKYLLLIYVYLVFNSFISLDKEIGLLRNLGFLRLIILFAAFNYFFNEEKFLKIVLTVWSLILIVILFDIFWESLNGQNIFGFGGDIYGRRIVSFFKDEPIVGGFVNSLYLIIIGFLFVYFKNKKNLILFFSLIFLIAIFVTGERSNTIRALLGITFFYGLFKDYDFKKKFIFFSSTLFLFLILLFNSEFLKLRYVNQIKSYLTTNQIYFNLYSSGYEVFKNYKLFGVGNKNYRIETCNINQEEIKKKGYICNTHPHQIYFELLSEHGIVGFLLLILLFYNLFFSKIFQTLKENNYIQIGCLIYLFLTFLPLLPSGAFFNDYMITLFMINLSIFYSSSKKLNIFCKQNKKN